MCTDRLCYIFSFHPPVASSCLKSKSSQNHCKQLNDGIDAIQTRWSDGSSNMYTYGVHTLRWSDRSYTAVSPVTPSLAMHYSHAIPCNVAIAIYVGKLVNIGLIMVTLS